MASPARGSAVCALSGRKTAKNAETPELRWKKCLIAVGGFDSFPIELMTRAAARSGVVEERPNALILGDTEVTLIQ